MDFNRHPRAARRENRHIAAARKRFAGLARQYRAVPRKMPGLVALCSGRTQFQVLAPRGWTVFSSLRLKPERWVELCENTPARRLDCGQDSKN
jgi:hypothetical protein